MSGAITPLHALLVDDLEAVRMCVVWPRVFDVVASADPADGELLRAWSRLSGVFLPAVRTRAPMLLGNALCLPDGTVDPATEQVATALVARAVAKRSKRR